MSARESTRLPSTIPHAPPPPGAVETACEITYEQLIKDYTAELKKALKENGKSDQTAKNHGAAIARWMNHLGLAKTDPVGPELGGGFKAALSEFLEAVQPEYGPQTLKDRKYQLTNWHEAFVRLSGRDGLPADFMDALNFLFERAGVRIYAVSRATGVPDNTIRHWLKRRERQHHPSRHSLEHVAALEAYFGTPPGALKRRVRRHEVWADTDTPPVKTEFAKKLVDLSLSPYRLKSFPAKLQKEWDDFVRYKTGDGFYLKKRKLRRRKPWRVRGDGGCPSADVNLGYVRGFFGYLCLPSGVADEWRCGKGFEPSELSLALLTDTDLIDDYMQFRKVRSGGYTSETLNTLTFCKGMVIPEFGYLRQQPEFGARLPRRVPAEEWEQWCEQSYQGFQTISGELEIPKPKFPFEKIKGILQQEHPIAALRDFAVRLEDDAPPAYYHARLKARHARNVLLVRLLTSNPLRIRHFSVMTYRPDNSGNLYRKEAKGVWRWFLRFPPESFKNEKGAAKDRAYDMEVPPSVWPSLENYLFNHRRHLYGAAESDFVFRAGSGPDSPEKGLKPEGPIPEKALSAEIRVLTQEYFPGGSGFGPHSFRHIVATDYIKHHPEGYNVAASILHDLPETVRKFYSWVTPAETFSHWVTYHELIIGGQLGADGGAER